MDTAADAIIRIPDFRDRFEQLRNGQPTSPNRPGKAVFVKVPDTAGAATDHTASNE